MYRACIFDLDGTLTDTLESLTYSVNGTLNELGLGSITSDQCRQFVGDGARALIERSLIAAGDSELTLIERAMEVYGRIFGEHCTYHVKPYEGIIAMLDALKERNVMTAVLSNKPHLQTIDVVREFLGEERFGCINGQRTGIEKKPDPAGVYETMKALGVTKEECLYIGDSDVDMETAKRAGVVSVGVTWGFRSREVLSEAGANRIVDTPEEIVGLV